MNVLLVSGISERPANERRHRLDRRLVRVGVRSAPNEGAAVDVGADASLDRVAVAELVFGTAGVEAAGEEVAWPMFARFASARLSR